MTTLASILPDPASVTAVRAIAEVSMDSAAICMQEFQSGFFVSGEYHPHAEVETETRAKPARVAGMGPSTTDRGQVKLW